MSYVRRIDGFDARLTVGFGVLHYRQEWPLWVLQPQVDQGLCSLLPTAPRDMQEAVSAWRRAAGRSESILAGEADKPGMASQRPEGLLRTPGLAQNDIDPGQVAMLVFFEPFRIRDERIDAGILEKSRTDIFQKHVYIIRRRSQLFALQPAMCEVGRAVYETLAAHRGRIERGTVEADLEAAVRAVRCTECLYPD